MKFFWKIFITVCILSVAASVYASDTAVRYTDEYLLNEQVQTQSVMLFSTAAEEQPYTDEQGIVYEIVNSMAHVSGWTGDIQDITIPSSVKTETGTYNVIMINSGAFRNCTTLKSVVISAGVTTIGNLVFDGCTSLETVELPNGIALINTGVFRYCTSLREISITDIQYGIRNKYGFWVEDGVLYGPTKDLTDNSTKTAVIVYPAAKTDTSYSVSEDAELIAAWAFSSCVNLQSITLPSSVKVVDGYAFQYCEGLSDISLSEGLLTIGQNAFDKCLSLEKVTIPESVTSIGADVFSRCSENIIILGEPGSSAEDYANNNNSLFNQARVTFVINGGESVESVITDLGQTVTEPENPLKVYFEFDGWYSDAECTEKWDFNTAVQKSISLYARRIKNPYKISITDNRITADLIDDTPKKIFAASYDESGKMIDAVMLDVAETVDLSALDTEGAESVRAFLWSGAERVFPLCAGAER